MDPNWAQILQAMMSIGTVLVAGVGLFFVWRQIRLVNRSILNNTNERLNGQSIEILKFLAASSETYDYFYNGKEQTDATDNKLKYAAEIVANHLEHVAMQVDNLPKDVQESWIRFVKDTYARSPIVRDHLSVFKEWYQPKLHEMVKGGTGRTQT
jgi:hypothetical protein